MVTIKTAPLGSPTWLLRLRWFAVTGQLITITLAGRITGWEIPFYRLVALVAVTAGSNLLFWVWLSRGGDRPGDRSGVRTIEWSLMAIDLMLLTAMLELSGGVDNPFCFFYFVNVAVGAVVLDVAAAWSLALLAFAGFASLHLASRDVPGITVVIADPPDWRIATWTMRQWGLVIAMGTCLAVVTLFVTNMAGLLRRREAELRAAEQTRADSTRLEALTTLAAGAAHELATPLSAIDIAARELSTHLRDPGDDDATAKELAIADLVMIDGQLEICKAVLARMRSAAGDITADRWQAVSLADLIDAALDGVRQPHRIEFDSTLPEEHGKNVGFGCRPSRWPSRCEIWCITRSTPRTKRVGWRTRFTSESIGVAIGWRSR